MGRLSVPHAVRGLRAVLVGAVALAGLAPVAHVAAAGPSLVQMGPGTTQLELRNLHALGAADPAAPLTVAVQISNPNLAGAYDYQRHVTTPGDPLFGRTLTSAQIRRRFSADPSRTAALVSWLQQGGVRIASVGDTGDTVWVQGATAQVASLFHVTIDHYRNRGIDFVANTTPPSVPANPGIIRVVGLNTAHRMSIADSGNTKARPAVGPPGAPTNLSPQDMWSLYDMPAGNFGQGQTMGVFAWGNTEAQTIVDVQNFDTANGLRRMPISIDDGYIAHDRSDHTQDGAIGEWQLDGAASTGMAQDAVKETYYFSAAPTDAAISAIFDEWENKDPNAPRQINASFGECEGDPALNMTKGLPVDDSDSMEGLAEPILMKATLQGRTLFTSTGDTGSGCPLLPVDVNGIGFETGPNQGYPAVSQFAVAVGGTTIFTNGDSPATRDLEIAWPYGGGGPSNHVQSPSFQDNVSNMTMMCATQPDGTPYVPPVRCRGIPDVAADADGNISSYAGTGGTSLSSPLWMGMWTRIQAAMTNQATGTGFADPLIYHWAETNPTDFTDIICCTNVPYPALPGWDYISGWGPPDLTKLMTDVAGRTGPVIASVAPGAGFPPSLPGQCGGTNVVTDPSGDATVSLVPVQVNTGSVDITGISFAVDASAKTLTTTMTIANLSQLPPGGTLDTYYNVVFDLPDGKTYGTQVVQPDPASLTFIAGPYNATSNQFVSSSAETGTVTTGMPGTIQVVAKLADLGNPSPTASPLVNNPYGITLSGYGILGAGLVLTAPDDRAPDSGYGHPWPVCAATVSNPGGGGPANAGSGPNAGAGGGNPNTAAAGGDGGLGAPMGAVALLAAVAGGARRRRRRRG